MGIPWYRREEYGALRASFPDRDQMHDTFDEWLGDVTRIERTMKDRGLRTLRVLIDAKSFPKWCQENGLPLDSKSRSRYAADQARRFFTSEESNPTK
jgi:hypothetical protein